jgi:NAD(P)H-binding
MANSKYTYLVLGGTGRTGKHFISLVLNKGHKVKALVRNPEKIENQNPNLEIVKGSIADFNKIDELLKGVDFVISMLGDAQLQKTENINTAFVKKLIPAMRQQGIKRFLYQAGGFTQKYKERLPFLTWIIKNTLARFYGLLGQHRDNEAVIEYLVEDAKDIEWMVHRASLISDGVSKGVLKRNKTRNSLATFGDCAEYNFNLLNDNSAIHTCDLSYYDKK